MAHYIQPKPSFMGSQRVLLFVTSDTCPWCNAELSEWQEFLSKAPLQSTAVILISFSGMRIPDAMAQVLSARKVRYQEAVVVNGPGFIGETGISGTPEIIAMDSGLRVRFLSARLTEALRQQIVAWASGRVEVSAADSGKGGGNES